MIKFVQGDIFKSKMQTLVATVNCVGIMGKGLAKEFKLRYPDMYKEYAKACKRGELQKGKLFLYRDLQNSILCFPTKDNWKGPSKYEFIEEGLKTLVDKHQEWGITSIAIPPLGSGLGGLDWTKVKALILKFLSDLPIEFEIYEPLAEGDRIPVKNPFRKMDKIHITPSLVYTGEMIRLARKAFPQAFPIGRLLLQKIAFFAQMLGLPIKLEFKKENFGPYDYKMKFNVDRLEGLFVRDMSTTIEKSNLVILDEEEWLNLIKTHDLDLEGTRHIIEYVVNFLKGYSLPQIELLASTMYAWAAILAAGELGSLDEIEEYLDLWKPKRFTHDQIEFALKELAKSGWLNAQFDIQRPSVPSEAIVLS